MAEVTFKVSAGQGEVPVVTVINTGIPTYTVTFDENGGTTKASPTTMTVNDGESLAALPTPPIYPGRSFLSWNTAKDGKGTTFSAVTIVTGNMTVYAQYSTAPLYTVTFNENGGTTKANPSTMSVASGSTVGTLPTPPTLSGYSFIEWNTVQVPTKKNPGQTFTASTTVSKSVTVYAQWALRKYFSSIAVGEYVSINGVSFQKISSTQLLSRNYIGSSYMTWNDAHDLAANFYTSF